MTNHEALREQVDTQFSVPDGELDQILRWIMGQPGTINNKGLLTSEGQRFLDEIFGPKPEELPTKPSTETLDSAA